ncbi:rhomboid family intramembrane serine protease [Opitutia bacterium ISCC 51]|nr:rhomboid family intramembrane serine protease [Opitutae bacterium ISCC 51]QXD26498.1 rhomboid family intramembrane serine protease [Opitutae bacterium ISCC 52]
MNETTALVTLIIIGLSAIMTFQGFKNQSLFARYMFDNELIVRNKEYERLLTSGLLHADWMHFAFNMFSLYSFGTYLELSYSPSVLLFIYITSILGGNLLSMLIYRNKPYRAIGASGGVCGVIYAAIFLLPGGNIMIFPLPLPIPSWVYAILFLLISAYGMRSARTNVGHVAHLGGALIGLAVTFLMFPQKVLALPELLGLVLLISAGIVIAELYRKRKESPYPG